MHSSLACVIFWQQSHFLLCRFHFSLSSHPRQSPLPRTTFSKDAPLAKCIIHLICSSNRRLFCKMWALDMLPICLPSESISFCKEHFVYRVYFVSRCIPTSKFSSAPFFLKVLFGSQIAETACDKASTSD